LINELMRIIDANINRASEGLRICEDYARFVLCHRELSETLKRLRHGIRKGTGINSAKLIAARDVLSDFGPDISARTGVDTKGSPADIVLANIKRTEEAVRTIEEYLKLNDAVAAAGFEKIRFECYQAEKLLMEELAKDDKSNKMDTDIYCITDSKHSLGRNNIDVVKQMLEEGIRIIQYREKDKTMREKYRECVALRKITGEYGAAFIVNDHPDLAVLVGADGVHLGQDDLPPNAARQIAGRGMLIGVSTHSPEQARRAVSGGADYIGVGPLFKTQTKKDVCDPVGLEYLDFVVKNMSIPFVAIGGIKEHNLSEVASHGAKLICLVTEITGAEDIAGKIKQVRNIITNVKRGGSCEMEDTN
jgi:thiamine-phosphate pyrophosphorylase